MFRTFSALALSVCASAAMAASVNPISYDMPNGERGSYTYYDDSYTGAGSKTTPLAALTGGLGDLTDGVIASDNWNRVPGQYVGWDTVFPTITFKFDQAQAFNSITVYFDDSNGLGGVTPPARFSALGQTTTIVDQASGAPFSATIDLNGAVTDEIALSVFKGSGSWVMLSEVTFDAQTPAVPLPASGLMLVGALGALAARRRR